MVKNNMNENLSVLRAIYREKMANNQFACESCGSFEYTRVVESSLVGGDVVVSNVIFKCNDCAGAQGGFSNPNTFLEGGEK